MVDRAERYSGIVERVAALYGWLDGELERDRGCAGSCSICGKCCDFHAYDHRLFITSPELIYFAAGLGTSPFEPMTSGKCPYNVDSKCTVHEHRFAGCRIFCCTGDRDFQSDLTERALTELKAICAEFDVPYRYVDLATGLNSSAVVIP